MVKAVVGEESRLKLAEDRLSQAALQSEVGLVIGKLSKSIDRGFIFDLIPTTQNDSGEPASSVIDSVKDDNKKKGSKGKAQSDSSLLLIDKDWIAEHALQLSRMLPGVTKVIGVYVWVSESTFKNSTMILYQTVKGVSEAAPSQEQRRDYLFTLDLVQEGNFRLPVCLEKGPSIRKFSDIIRRGLSVHAKMLKGEKALIDGRLCLTNINYTSLGTLRVRLAVMVLSLLVDLLLTFWVYKFKFVSIP